MSPSKLTFAEIERNLEKTKKVSNELSKKQSEIDSRINSIVGTDKITPLNINMDDDSFEAVHENAKAVEANLATMIYNLDEITRSFGDEFKNMSEKTTSEKIMGFFSKRKSEEMRTDRIRSTNIRDNLNQLISKSDTIQSILIEQRSVLEERYTESVKGQSKVLEQSRTVASEIEKLENKLAELAPKISALDDEMIEATGEKRRELETRRTDLVNEYNDLNSTLQSKAAEQQSFEKYTSQFANYVDSLAKQKAAQITLINKLKIDTEQRIILYDALTESLRTATQQDTAHRINSVGQETDSQAEALMLQVGTSSQNRIASMLDAHSIYMNRSKEIYEKGKIANDAFNKKFAEILEKSSSGNYGS